MDFYIRTHEQYHIITIIWNCSLRSFEPSEIQNYKIAKYFKDAVKTIYYPCKNNVTCFDYFLWDFETYVVDSKMAKTQRNTLGYNQDNET